MDKARVDRHAWEIGRIVGTLQTIEAGMRCYLFKSENPEAKGPLVRIPREGEMMPVNPITNFDQLGTLADKFNADAAIRGLDTVRKDDLVRLRDAIAHGRALKPHGHRNLYLFKFDKPPKDGGPVRVCYSVEMNAEWY